MFDDCLVPAYNVKRLKGIMTVEGTVKSLLQQLRCSSSKECRITLTIDDKSFSKCGGGSDSDN